MKNGTCPKCNSTNVYFKPYALDKVTLDGRSVECTDYVCTDCGYFETYITDKDTLGKIPIRAEKLGDWKKADTWNMTPAIYDGDTPSSARSTIRRSARILLTNPDMLHTGILLITPTGANFFPASDM